MLAVDLTLTIICIFALLLFVVHKVGPKRFRASGEVGWKSVKFSVEADADTARSHTTPTL